jgi:hypothetical protein
MKKTILFLILVSAQVIAFSQEIDYAKAIIEKLCSPEFNPSCS